MKTLFSSKTLIAVAVAIAAAAAIETQASEQPIPPPATDSSLPAGISPGSPVAQVVKLVQAGVDASVIQVYISNCPTAFNLDADKIIALTDAGLPGDYVNQMFAHDKNFLSSLSTSAAPPPATTEPSAPAPVVASAPPPVEPAPAPPQEVTVNYFYDNLAPYGGWVNVEGYGRCWRPNIVVYDSNWRPYCDRGSWVYTDCGWYWQSDYAWGATFHYGRWFNSPHYGWCWWPDTVWAPSWVTWRSCNDYCGWAPLPPYTVYQPGIGFSYHGNHVAVGFDFGLSASCFSFVSIGNFCQPHPRNYCVPAHQVGQFYGQTTIINNFDCNRNTICNNGVSVTVIGNSSHHPIQAVPVHSMGAGHRGGPTFRYYGTDNSDGSQNRQFTGTDFRHGPPMKDNDNHNNGFNRGSGLNAGNTPATSANNDLGQNRHTSGVVSRKPSEPTDGRNGRDLVLTGQGGNSTSRPNSPVAGQLPSATPVRDPNRNHGNNNGFNRQAIQPTAPVVSTTPAAVTTRPTQNTVRNGTGYVAQRPTQPAINSVSAGNYDRPQRSEPRQNFSQVAPRNFASAAPQASAPVQSMPQTGYGNGRFQGWMAQNR
jgi:hypothetical protein